MRLNLRLAAVIAVGSGLGIALVAARPAGAPDAEVARILTHLAAVESTLRQRDVSTLSSAQRAARADLLDVLREYRHAGRFPHNHVRPGLTPVFRDEHGALCAVGYLIERSGRGDLVDAVAERRNLASVPVIAANPALGPALAEWLAEHGFTVEEAAQIQPWYGERPDPPPPSVWDPLGGHVIASMVAGGFGIISGVVGISSSERSGRLVTGLVGVGSGAIQLGLAGSRLSGDGDLEALGRVDAVLGVASLVLGGLNLARATRSTEEYPRVQPVIEPGVGGTRVGLGVAF